MIKKIGKQGAYVSGAFRSALYDFSTGKVYSIDQEGTKILSDYFSGRMLQSPPEFIPHVTHITGLQLSDFSDYTVLPPQLHLDFVWLELTSKCNLRCIHCYQGNSHVETSAALSVSEWEEVILQCHRAGCQSIQFIGGEPSTCKFLPHLIVFARDLGIQKISIFSNLFSITEDLLSSIVTCGVAVNFSIYGPCAAIHDSITQVPGSFEKLIGRIRQLAALPVLLRAKIVIMRENEGEYCEIVRLLHALGVNSIHYDEIRKVYGGTQKNHMPLGPKLQHRYPNFRTSRAQFEKALSTNTCWFGKIAISPEGFVYPCEFERQILYGNIRRSPLNDILASEMVEKYWYFSFDKISPCRDCEYRFACRDCRPMAYAERGCLMDKNPRCCYNPMTGEWKPDGSSIS